MQNIKVFKEGERLILTIDNPTRSQIDMVNDVIAVGIKELSGLDPSPVKEEKPEIPEKDEVTKAVEAKAEAKVAAAKDVEAKVKKNEPVKANMPVSKPMQTQKSAEAEKSAGATESASKPVSKPDGSKSFELVDAIKLANDMEQLKKIGPNKTVKLLNPFVDEKLKKEFKAKVSVDSEGNKVPEEKAFKDYANKMVTYVASLKINQAIQAF